MDGTPDPRHGGVSALLLMLLDGRAPAGAHSHSGGMEAAVNAGFVSAPEDVEAFCRGRLRTAAPVAGGFAATACRIFAAHACAARGDVTAAVVLPPPSRTPAEGSDVARQFERLDAELDARTPSEALRGASRQLGSGLRRLVRSMVPGVDLDGPFRRCPAPAPHHPIVLGAAVAAAGGEPELAARAAALGAVAAPAAAAVRLLGLDPYAVQALLARLAPEVDAVAGQWRDPDLAAFGDLPADSTPALELLADIQLTMEVRLFAS